MWGDEDPQENDGARHHDPGAATGSSHERRQHVDPRTPARSRRPRLRRNPPGEGRRRPGRPSSRRPGRRPEAGKRPRRRGRLTRLPARSRAHRSGQYIEVEAGQGPLSARNSQPATRPLPRAGSSPALRSPSYTGRAATTSRSRRRRTETQYIRLFLPTRSGYIDRAMPSPRASRINVTPVKSFRLHHPDAVWLGRQGRAEDRRFTAR